MGDLTPYAIDVRASQFTVQAFAGGLISAVAHSPKIAIRDWSAEIGLSAGAIVESALRATIKLSSLEVLDQIRDDDRRELHRVMSQEVLEIARFPEAKFESSQIVAEQLKPELYRVNISGPLTLHGMTNTHSFRAQVALGVDSLRSYGEFAILQTDYGIRIASIAGGTLKLQDELKFSFYVVARKQA